MHTSIPLPGQKKNLAGCAVASKQLAWEEWKIRKYGLRCFGKRTIPESNRGQICETFHRTVTEDVNLSFAIALPLQGISALNLYTFVLVAAQQFSLPHVAYPLFN